MTTRVGYIGLGDMGGAMASNLAPKGFDARVYDLDPWAHGGAGGRRRKGVLELPRGRRACRGALDLRARGCTRRGGAPVGDEGALAGMAPGSIVAIHSTVQPSTIERMAAAARERGVDLIDACVTGGRAVAESGELTLLIGGDSKAVERARPVLEAYGTTLIHAGALGAGAKLKLCVNLLTYVNWAAAAESFRLAKASGLDTEKFLEAVISNGQLSEMQQRFIAGQKLPDEAAAGDGYQDFVKIQMFNAEKDLAHALELGRTCGIALPAAGGVAQDMARIYRVIDEGRR